MRYLFVISRTRENIRQCLISGQKNERPRGQNCLQGLVNTGSPTWARTRDLRINSPALYRLSYRGIEARIIDAGLG